MPCRRVQSPNACAKIALAVALALGVSMRARGQDWPQWRGPAGQGTTTARNLPPSAGSDALKVLWKTALPGDGCSSPIVSNGRVFLTTAYEGSQRHPLDEPSRWLALVLACGVVGLALAKIPQAWQALARGPLLGAWTLVVIVLTAVVLAKPTWFWRFADPWTGTTLAPAELAWVESFNLRPVLVLVFGSLLLIFISLANFRSSTDAPPTLTAWLDLVAFCITLTCGVLLGLVAWQPDCFYQPSQPWLAWIVTGAAALFGFAGNLGWIGARQVGCVQRTVWDSETSALPSPTEERIAEQKSSPTGAFHAPYIRMIKLALSVLGIALAGWLFGNLPHDEFGNALRMQNRLVFLAPAFTILLFQAAMIFLQRTSPAATVRDLVSCGLMALLGASVFVRANYLQPETGVVRAVVCVDGTSGAILWNTPVFVAAAEKKHSLNSLATPTPACDGERVYAYFGSGLAALDISGRVLWLKRDDEFRDYIRYGAGSSVVLADDKILIYRDSEFMGHGHHLDEDIQQQIGRRASALTAYDKASGAIVWSVSPPFSHDSYMTPIVWQRDDRHEAIIATWKTLAGIDIRDGSVLWTHAYPMQQVVPSPAVNGDCLIATGGNMVPCPIVAVRAPSQATPAITVWSNSKTGGNIVSPVCWDGLLFSTSHAGVLTCRDAESGRIHWTQRLGSRCLASLLAGDGKIYALDQEGTLQIFAADATGTELATHSFGETCPATPALTPSGLFVRTARHLYCVGSGSD